MLRRSTFFLSSEEKKSVFLYPRQLSCDFFRNHYLINLYDYSIPQNTDYTG